jgi:hypothetical protein
LNGKRDAEGLSLALPGSGDGILSAGLNPGACVRCGLARFLANDMTVMICTLRGVNLGAHHRVKMEELKTLCKSLELREPQTYVQSGNIIFKTDERDHIKIAKRIEGAKSLDFRPTSY